MTAKEKVSGRKGRGKPGVELAVAYVRGSTDDQQITLSVQADKIKSYCSMRGLRLAHVLQDAGVSGSVPLARRPAGRKLAPLLAKSGASHIVGLKLDRLFRDASDALAQTKAWDRDGIALHLCDVGGGAVDTSSPMGRMMLTMLAGFAEFERALIAERTRAALRHKMTKGEFTGGTPRYGSKVEGAVLVDDPREQAAIAEARRLRAEGGSLRAVAAAMAGAGMLARNGRPFAPNQIQRMLA